MNSAVAARGYIEAELTLLTPEQGGRPHPIRTGYCPNWWLPGATEREFASGCVELITGAELRPGASGVVRIYPLAPELWDHVTPGARLDMTEGPQFPVGRAVVTRVVRSTVAVGQP
jgi:hypothetical protein